MRLTFTLNGDPVAVEAPTATVLLDLLRDRLGLRGTKWGCRVGDCGACTVLVDERPSLSCLQLAAQVDGRAVVTIEGLTPRAGLSDLQAAFVEAGAIQCGYCTPGMIVAAEGLLRRDGPLDEATVRADLNGNLCRCTGYYKIVEAVLATAGRRAAAGG
jgi:aerobic-type carbon monoxide dehydrogenase small subunit (CoxS/CutS family)